jgi:hypothetical protein
VAFSANAKVVPTLLHLDEVIVNKIYISLFGYRITSLYKLN